MCVCYLYSLASWQLSFSLCLDIYINVSTNQKKERKTTSKRKIEKKMGKKCSSKFRQMLVLVLLLIVFTCLSVTAPLSVTAKPTSFKVKARGIEDEGQERTHSLNSKKSSRSVEKTHHSEGRRLSNVFPNAGIRAGPSKSGQGGGRIPVAAS